MKNMQPHYHHGADCSSQDVVEECNQLTNSIVNLQSYPLEKKIRLEISHQLKFPLNLTLHHAQCNISCEGGHLNSCHTFVEDYYWKNVTSAFYFENCAPLHHYCVTAMVGNCCPVCTETIFMKEHNPQPVITEGSSWGIAICAIIVILVITMGFGVLIEKYYVKGLQTARQLKLQKHGHVPLNQQNSDITHKRSQITVIIMYVKEENKSFLDDIDSLQTFLRRGGLRVVDLYNEEETLIASVHHWVQRVTTNQNTKFLLVDTALFRTLWDYDPVKGGILRPLEQAILYTRSCIPMKNMHNHCFIVRFQTRTIDEEEFVGLGNGRQYIYPINSERLLEDLMHVRNINE